jgi:hypothetical protein
MAGIVQFLPAARKARFVLSGALVVLLFSTGRAAADEILASSDTAQCSPVTACSYEGGVDYPSLDQQFTVTSTVSISSVDAFLAYSFDGGDFAASDLTMSINNDSSGAPGSTVYATDTGVTGTLSAFPISGTYSDINFAFNFAELSPATYWLVIQMDVTHFFDWQYQQPGTTDSAGLGGVIDADSYYGSVYSNTSYVTTINGTVDSVPEPATLTLGAVFVVFCVLRRRVLRARV